MRKFPILKCPICGKAYKEVGTFGNHMRNEHPGTIPEDWSNLRYAYFVHTGKSRGRCRECGGETPWNEATGAYAKICGSEACRKKFRDRFMAGMRARYGRSNLLDDPNFRERMLTHRRISGEYEFSDGGKVGYMGTLEKNFLQMLDVFFRFPSADVLSPSPNRYLYYYENENDLDHKGMHTYVPDFFIPSCNLEIELKAKDNQRPKYLMIDSVKDAAKDIMMLKNPIVNYVKIYADDFHVFFQVFADMAAMNERGEEGLIKYISRSILTTVYRDYIPDEQLKILDQYAYRYSDRSVLKKPANESMVPTLESYDEMDENVQDETPIRGLTNPIIYYADNEPTSPPDTPPSEAISEKEDENSSEITGVNPLMYYMMGEYAPHADGPFDDPTLDCFTLDDDHTALPATEADLQIDTGTVAGRAAKKFGKWRDKLFGSKLLGSLAGKAFVKVTTENGRIVIKGINCNLLLYRIKDHYGEAKLRYIFEYQYNARSWKMYQKKKIGRGDMKIDYVYAPEFFCLELVELFTQLADAYNDASYRTIAQLIYQNSWLSKADMVEVPPLSLEPLSALRLELLPHQKQFIELWPSLKNQLHLNGYILAFQPGKGKTLTAVGLCECLHAKKVYIVCPNNLKDNWALEIKKYYAKYDDEQLWMKDVCILGTKYGNPDTARFIITNNENIKLMMPVAKNDPDAVLILDESHNFRNYQGGRSKELFDLADKIGSQNVLCVSATPIKAVPAELTPALRLIDPTFNDEAATMYAKCFALNDVMAMSIVNKRFGKVIYRPADVAVDLPPKRESDLPLGAPDEQRYYLDVVNAEVIADFKKRQEEWLKTVKGPRADFEASIRQYAMTSKANINAYLAWVTQSSNSLDAANGTDFHELEVKGFLSFIDDYVRPNPKAPAGEPDRLQQMQNEFVTACKSNMGKAVGSIYPKRRSDMFINIWDQNRQLFYDKIRNRGKKTVIFSTMVGVVNHITDDLNDFGIGAVSITGSTKDRLSVLTQFREDPNTLVLVATSWCMGVGVTLTEASQMFFFGAPWRSTDYEQASDRIWRIGQTDPVDIVNVKLKSSKRNLSDRMQAILDWSARMFGSAITASEIDDTPQDALLPAQEYYGKGMIYDIIFELNAMLNEYSYGMQVGNKIVDPEDKTEYDRNYRTLSPGAFKKLKGGICFDYAAFQDFWLKSHGCHGELYFIEILDPYMTHAFSVYVDGNRYIYFESAFQKIQGIYIAPNLDMIVSFIINNMIQGKKVKNLQFNVFHVKPIYGYYGYTMNEYLHHIHEEGTPVQIHYDKRVTWLDRIDFSQESYGGFNPNQDDWQYQQLDPGESEILNGIFRTYNETQPNYCAYHKTLLPGKMPTGPLLPCCKENAHADCKSPHMAFSDFEAVYHTVKKLVDRQFKPFVFVLDVVGISDHRLLHPVVVIPFHDGALWLESGFNYRCNGLYFASKVQDIGGMFVRWVAQCFSKSGGEAERDWHPNIHIYPISISDVLERWTNMTYEDFLLEYSGHHKQIQFPFSMRDLEEPFKVEVFGYGWSVNRI